MDKIKEDMASTGAFNSAGGGGVDGIGVGPKSEPGVYQNKKKLRILFPMLKRNPLGKQK
jgi:hypothetical protein